MKPTLNEKLLHSLIMKHHIALLTSVLVLLAVAPLSAADVSAPAPAAPATAKSAYPLTTCLVSDEALGSMGDPYVHVYKQEGKPDREVRLCCKGCLKRFIKDPAKYLGKLDAAAKAAAEKPAAAADAHAGHAH